MTLAALSVFAKKCHLCFHGFIRGDNFASTLREPEPTIDSEDFDERLRAAVAERRPNVWVRRDFRVLMMQVSGNNTTM